MSRVLLERPPDVYGMMNKQKQTFGIFLSLSNSAWDFLGLPFCRNFFWEGVVRNPRDFFCPPVDHPPDYLFLRIFFYFFEGEHSHECSLFRRSHTWVFDLSLVLSLGPREFFSVYSGYPLSKKLKQYFQTSIRSRMADEQPSILFN